MDGNSLNKQSKIPIYRQLKDILSKSIKKDFKPDSKFYSEAQIAKTYNISTMTANKVLSELTVEGLLYRIQGKGTFVVIPENKKSMNIQVIYSKCAALPENNAFTWFNTFFIVRGILDACNEFNMKFTSEDFRPGGERELVLDNSDGVIIINPNKNLIELLNKKNIKFVVAYGTKQSSNCSQVIIDRIKAGYNATSHLINLGHRRIGFLGNYSAHDELRLKGHKDALSDSSIPFNEKICNLCDMSDEQGKRRIFELLSSRNCPTAFFASSDIMAFEIIKAAQKRKIRVPEDIAVVGYDDLPESVDFEPPLTTLHTPNYESGYEAVKLLMSSIQTDEKAPQTKFLLPKLIIRKSCGAYLKCEQN